MGNMTVSPIGNASSSASPVVKATTPLTGQTLVFDAASYDQTYDLTPAGLLAALTITLPTEASSVIGQTVAIFNTQTITVLTIGGATTIRNLATSMAGGTKIFMRKVRANTWDTWLS